MKKLQLKLQTIFTACSGVSKNETLIEVSQVSQVDTARERRNVQIEGIKPGWGVLFSVCKEASRSAITHRVVHRRLTWRKKKKKKIRSVTTNGFDQWIRVWPLRPFGGELPLPPFWGLVLSRLTQWEASSFRGPALWKLGASSFRGPSLYTVL